jgi:hypothetical protein
VYKKDKTLKDNLMGSSNERLDVFQKIELIRSLIASNLGEMTNKEIQSALCRCWYYNLGRRKEISQKQHEILDLLLKNNIKPKAAYNYFLLSDTSENIKKKLQEKRISIKDAVSLNSQWRRVEGEKGSEKLMEEMRDVLRRLTWKSQEGN